MIVRLESLSFVNVQYDRWVIGNNNDDDDQNEWLIDGNNNPNSVSLLKWQRKQHNQAGRIDILIIIES